MIGLPAAQVTHNLGDPDDLANLRSSGLSDETILAMGCRSVSAETIREATGIASVPCGGYSIPYPGLVDQVGAPLRRWRLRQPAAEGQRYVAGLGDDPALYIPPGFASLPPNHDLLVITEGEKKAAAAVQAGIHCVALQGVWSWMAPGPRQAEKLTDQGVSADTVPLASLLDVVRPYKRVLILGDSDLLEKHQAAAGLNLLAKSLVQRDIRAAFSVCPPNIVGDGVKKTHLKQGLDDWICAKGDQARRTLHALFRAGELTEKGMSDFYNGHEIALHFKGRFCYSRGVWWHWEKDAIIWVETAGRQYSGIIGACYRADCEALGSLVAMVESALGPAVPKGDPNETLRRQLKPWLKGTSGAAKLLWEASLHIESVKGFGDALKMAEHSLGVDGSAWDSDEHLLACQNGVVDLRTKELLPPSPQYLCTKIAGAPYDPAAQCPLFHAFLEQVQPDPEVRYYLQLEAGYCAWGTAKEQRLSVHEGGGANGKGTYITALMGALGTYAAKGAPSILAQLPAAKERHDLAHVAGARLVSISETSGNFALDENTLKSITGGDLLTCRDLYGHHFSYKPTYSLLLDTNHPITPHEQGEAMTRRLRYIPWGVTILKQDRDPDLGKKLQAERTGILAWEIQGAQWYYERGLPEVEAITLATKEQLAASDVVGLWIEQRCILAPGACSQSTPLYLSFQSWAKAEGNTFVMGTRAFARRMREKGFVPGKNSVAMWHGLRLREISESGEQDDGTASSPDPEAAEAPAVHAAAPPPPSPPISKDISQDELKHVRTGRVI
jgi:putative DNA primase/helicase